MTNYNLIPIEIYQNIFKYLYFIDIFSFSNTNKINNKIVKNYYCFIFPKTYNYLCDTIQKNIINGKYLLTNCNITYPIINKRFKENKSILFIDEIRLEDGIYYFSENVWRNIMISNEYILEYVNEIYYHRYLIISKNKDKIFVCSYKKRINGTIETDTYIHINLKPYSKIFRLF